MGAAEGFEFRRPLGLVLAGGGALGAWQAGCLEVLTDARLPFDKVLGFSAGALSGAGMFMGRMPELMHRWRRVDEGRILRFSPRLRPLSLFSDAALRESVTFALDEERARAAATFEFIVVSLDVEDDMPMYARFTPPGGLAWDGPLADRLVASCSIPKIFPPVRIGARTYIDGGIPGKEWLRCDALAGCRDVIVVEMIRPEEIGRRFWSPLARYEQIGREVVHRQIECGVESLRAAAEPPRIFRLFPSRVLDFTMLDFRSQVCVPALELGRRDGECFLDESFRHEMSRVRV